MEASHAPQACQITRATLARLTQALTDDITFACDAPLYPVTLAELVGDADANALAMSVLECAGAPALTVRSWHVLRADRLTPKPQLVKDITTSNAASTMCVLLCVAGEGIVTIGTITEKTVGKRPSLRLVQGQCVVYQSNLVYTVEKTIATTYIHCACTPQDIDTTMKIFFPVKYPCPFNTKIEVGDVRVFPRKFQPTGISGCSYRGARWMNVLDHWVFCKFNPEKGERCPKSIVEVLCDQCDHPGFTLMNSLIQHKARHHRAPRDDPEDDEDNDFDWFLSPQTESDPPVAVPERKLKRRRVPDRPNSLVVSSASLLDQFNFCLVSTPQVCNGNEPLSEEESYQVVSKMLETVSRSDVRQPRGRMEYNAGEMTFHAVTSIVKAFGHIAPGDVFVDIGAGVGNVALQIAVQTRFAVSIAVEMRSELILLTQKIVDQHEREEKRLSKVIVITADITEQDVADLPPVVRATHVFSHNTVFTESAVLAVERLCWLPQLRRIALTRQPCPRHRDSCTKDFCKIMKLESTIRVPVSYTDSLVQVYIYSKSECWL